MRLRFLMFAAAVSVYAAAFTPAFVSLKSPEVNVRVGPGKEYPVSWTFMRANLPVILVAEFNQWRKVKFIDNTEGWVHQNMISRKNTAIVTSEHTILYRYASNSHPTAKLEKNVIVKVIKKDKDWVKAEVNKIKGWIKKEDLWGVNED